MVNEKIYKRILLPMDNSPTDEAILQHIRPLAQLTQAELILVHVADGYGARLQEQLNLADSQEIKDDSHYLTKIAKELGKEGFKVKHYLCAGDPAKEILKVADKECCDLIAMATHGHGPLKDFFLGSVADDIRHKTSIPVLMIRAVK
jgi:nucleotide-binding universal stress UspA family protein